MKAPARLVSHEGRRQLFDLIRTHVLSRIG
jgi:hypothetical protein